MAFRPLSSTNSTPQNYGQVNDMMRQINNEQTTKGFKQPGGYSVITGKLPYPGGYGTLYYDSNNVPRILIGTSPDDGRIGIWTSKAGQNVITLLGG